MSSKLLEVTVISAQNLPPVAKLLRTYAVAWLQPHQKLTTTVDHRGHTNPQWNYKLVFPLDHNFSQSVLTVEIYNVVWLRDIPIGTAQVLVSNLVPNKTNNVNRPFALRLCRPTGLLQGIVNVRVNLIDVNSSVNNVDRIVQVNNNIQEQRFDDDDDDMIKVKVNEKITLKRSRSERTAKDDDFVSTPALTRSKSVYFESICSVMHPIPSEVAGALRKGVQFSGDGGDFGSSIFENWTENGDKFNEANNKKVVKWQQEAMKDLTPVIDDRRLRPSGGDHRRRSKKGRGGGLLSCFGNINGMEISFICGNNEAAKKKKKEMMMMKGKAQGFNHLTNHRHKLGRSHIR